MERIFLGGFINDIFVLPQYEIINGVPSYIKPGNKPGARKDVFPDDGTVILRLSVDQKKEFGNRILKFRIDFKNDRNSDYERYKANRRSDIYEIKPENIITPDENEIIVIADAGDVMADDSESFTLTTEYNPGREVLLKTGDRFRGPFLCCDPEYEGGIYKTTLKESKAAVSHADTFCIEDSHLLKISYNNGKGDKMHWIEFVYGLPKRENPQEIQEVAAEISELKEERDAIRAEKDAAEMEAEISGLKEERDAIRAEKDAVEKEVMQLRAFTDRLKAEQASIHDDMESKIMQWAVANHDSALRDLLIGALLSPDAYPAGSGAVAGEIPEPAAAVRMVPGEIPEPAAAVRMIPEEIPEPSAAAHMIPEEIPEPAAAAHKTPEEIMHLLRTVLEKAGRTIDEAEIYNSLICITQNYITVFAGEPGTGKTSFCTLLAKAFGIYHDRFAEVLVEKGWTSPRDLIGYYNPLTKEIESSQPVFTACIEQLDAEQRNGSTDAPYLVLLDEANLSPIEYYWSTFSRYSDDPASAKVVFPNGKAYLCGEALRFLATINYDHTTSDLSPRFLDRAWVISMEPAADEENGLSGSMADDTEVGNGDVVVSWESLQEAFGKNAANAPAFEEDYAAIDAALADITRLLGSMHPISSRSRTSMRRYCRTAVRYMERKAALDFAVAQKILPRVDGYGDDYRAFLEKFGKHCDEKGYERSSRILRRIMERSAHDFYSFFSL